MSYILEGIKNIAVFIAAYVGVGYLIGSKIDDITSDVIIPVCVFSVMEIYSICKRRNKEKNRDS